MQAKMVAGVCKTYLLVIDSLPGQSGGGNHHLWLAYDWPVTISDMLGFLYEQ